jgi:hypothetical protein
LPAQGIFSPSSVSLFDLKAGFFVPTRALLAAARAEAVKVGRRTNLSACSALFEAERQNEIQAEQRAA